MALNTGREAPRQGEAETRTLRERVRAGDRLLGLIFKMPAPFVVEMAAHAGFDLVVLDGEHGGDDTEALEHHIRAAEGAGIPALVRIGARTPIDVLRALDAGAAGIIAPHVVDASTAQEVVCDAHYPPIGRRGLATSTRAGKHGFVPLREHVERAARDTTVIVQIEDEEALPRVGDIAGVPRVDMVFIGPTDLSLSLGHPGDLEHPDVRGAIDGIIADVQAAGGVQLGAFARNERDAQTWLGRGVSLVLFSPTILFGQRLSQVVDALR